MFFSSQRFFTTGQDIFHIIWFAWLSPWPCLSKSFVILCQIFTETQWLQRHQTHRAETIDAAFTMPPKRSRLAAPLPPMRRADLSQVSDSPRLFTSTPLASQISQNSKDSGYLLKKYLKKGSCEISRISALQDARMKTLEEFNLPASIESNQLNVIERDGICVFQVSQVSGCFRVHLTGVDSLVLTSARHCHLHSRQDNSFDNPRQLLHKSLPREVNVDTC